MRTVANSRQGLHAPEFEFYRGRRVPCFGSPARFDIVEKALRGAGCAIEAPAADWFAALEAELAAIVVEGAEAMVVSLDLHAYEGDPISRFRPQTADYARLCSFGLPTLFLRKGAMRSTASAPMSSRP